MARLNDSLSPFNTPSARPRVLGVMLEVEKALAGIDNGGRLRVAPAAAAAVAAAAHSRLLMMPITVTLRERGVACLLK